MKNLLVLILIAVATTSFGQKVEDLFKPSDTPIYWLGVDFSKVQLVGDFSQFGDAGTKSTIEIKNNYFPGWNALILNEPKKYDIKGMLRKENLSYRIDMITEINTKVAPENMEAQIPKKFVTKDIESHVRQYHAAEKDGIGIVFIAETLDKIRTEAWFHVVAVNLSTNEVLFSERMRGAPAGFGLRNYWAGAIYDIIKQVNKTKWPEWKSKFS